MLQLVVDCSETDRAEQTSCEFFPNSQTESPPLRFCWSGGALFHLGYKHTHTHRGRLINNATVTVMNHDRWWQKVGDEYIQIIVLGRYMKYYCVRDGTFSTITSIPQARYPALMLSVKADFFLGFSHPQLWCRSTFYQAIQLVSATGVLFLFSPFLAGGEREPKIKIDK